ncbi:MAG: DUF2231 domain-containing protein [Desulfobaccales bacterium]
MLGVSASSYSRPQDPGLPRLGREVPPGLEGLLRRFPWLRRHPHPMLSHFPIVFMLSATFFSVLYVMSGDKSFDDTAFYCLGAGLATMPLAVATGLFTHWLNFPGGLHKTVHIEKTLSYSVLAVSTAAFVWRWMNPNVLANLRGINFIYFLMVLSLTPLVTANGYFGGMVTFPLEDEALQTEKGQTPGLEN